MQAYEGGCLCGAVRYVAEGEPLNQRICHCRLCQRAIGAAFNARLLFAGKSVTLRGWFKTFNSSPDLQRGFCGRCGTTVFSARESTKVIGITAASLDEPERFRPTMHFWTSSKQPWVNLDDGLPHYPEGPPT
ncbi:GFA family protein [Micromonospora sp. STR1s_5]|nr:GFA family protein [Micromonospora sp. STR1s_5]